MNIFEEIYDDLNRISARKSSDEKNLNQKIFMKMFEENCFHGNDFATKKIFDQTF